MGGGGGGGGAGGPLFESRGAKGRLWYKLYAASVLVGIFLIWVYRAIHLPKGGGGGGEGRLIWIGLFGAEIFFGLYWILTQVVRWNPIYHQTFKGRLSKRYENDLPPIDIFVCTADPTIEPPMLVVNTVLSMMAFDYPTKKLSVYLSDDGFSQLTFYALLEAASFSKFWIPYCNKFKVEQSPASYFSSVSNLTEFYSANEFSAIKILIDGRDPKTVDVEGVSLPTLVYVAREKRHEYPHNFKAGAINALIRVSSEISDAPFILIVDCDMYSNSSQSVRDAMCFFMDGENGHDIAFVQFPQNFRNLHKNNTYGDYITIVNEILSLWFIPFAYIITATQAFSLLECLRCGETFTSWWNMQKMKMMRRTTSYLFSFIDTTLQQLGLGNSGFIITAKIAEDEALKRFSYVTALFVSLNLIWPSLLTYQWRIFFFEISLC
ncbi:uncharacterized protein A4U43_C05F14140 [Asparagus officinalis]|uniref:Glycosyltransferase 2-like domain-containing protein n=1 Tax=Asparagus officinalis TaxID=4686 RepID=A0A5P1EWX7_ASPOF|nr:uncharacterized protein A4U43_C05F14140 [Asparagus officinalis]